MSDYPSYSSPIGDWPNNKCKFCNAPRIFTGFNPKPHSDLEGTKSPTSPLDIEIFSGVGFTRWYENSLDFKLISPKQQSETIPIGSSHGFTQSTSQTGMEHSESYTCVTSHGPKSISKHIFSHCGVQCETVQCPVRKQHEHGLLDVASPPRNNSNVPVFHVEYFLSACYLCKCQLNHGKDIYMYRGDKAFCSVECRYQQILMDERMETFPASPPSSRSATSYGGIFFLTSTAAAS
eukprot:PITA_23538